MLEDWRTADVDDKVRVTLEFLEKLTLQPESIGPRDVAPLYAARISREAVADAVYVCFLFSVIARIADALEFDVPSVEEFARSADGLLKHGYKGDVFRSPFRRRREPSAGILSTSS